MDGAHIARILKDYGVEASPALCESIRLYTDLLLKWNQKVNLTSITAHEEIIGRHFGESLFAIHAVPLRPRNLVDIGSGAGFPGLALKLMLPEARITLIEANTKKAAFLNEVARQIELEQVTVLRARTEEVDPIILKADCITARAVGRLGDMLEWSRASLVSDGKLVLWLGADGATRAAELPGWSWTPPIPIPHSQRRVLLVGTGG